MGVNKAVFLDMCNNRSQALRIVAVEDQVIASQQEVADLFFDTGLVSERLDVRRLWDRDFTLLTP
jgi:sulfonate transport system substrate-binding protein